MKANTTVIQHLHTSLLSVLHPLHCYCTSLLHCYYTSLYVALPQLLPVSYPAVLRLPGCSLNYMLDSHGSSIQVHGFSPIYLPGTFKFVALVLTSLVSTYKRFPKSLWKMHYEKLHRFQFFFVLRKNKLIF